MKLKASVVLTMVVGLLALGPQTTAENENGAANSQDDQNQCQLLVIFAGASLEGDNKAGWRIVVDTEVTRQERSDFEEPELQKDDRLRRSGVDVWQVEPGSILLAQTFTAGRALRDSLIVDVVLSAEYWEEVSDGQRNRHDFSPESAVHARDLNCRPGSDEEDSTKDGHAQWSFPPENVDSENSGVGNNHARLNFVVSTFPVAYNRP